MPMTNAEVADFARLLDSYESDPARDAMGLPAGYGVVNLETVRRLIATITLFDETERRIKAALYGDAP